MADLDFAIIGAGYGGLSAAALLAKKGFRVAVFEKAAVVGGRSACYEKDGFVWQYGQHSHRLEKNGMAARVFDRLGSSLEFVQIRKGKAKIFCHGKLYNRPEGLVGILTTSALSLPSRIDFVRLYIKILKADPAEWWDRSLQEFFRTWFDNSALEKFISFLGFAVMLPDPAAVSAGEVIDFIQRAARAPVKQGEPVGGAKQVLDKLCWVIRANGGLIQLAEKVFSIDTEAGCAVGITTGKGHVRARHVVYAAPLQHFADLIEPGGYDASFIDRCRRLESSAGVVVDFVSDRPLSDLTGGIIGVDIPIWVKFQTNIDPSVAPPGKHVCTWGILVERGRGDGPTALAAAERRLREAAAVCMPGFEAYVLFERRIVCPVVNANMLTCAQARPHRAAIRSHHVENLYFVGDTTAGEGCSGDIAFSSALMLADLFEREGS
jgi:phytoene dehydrogenase-like protein